MKINFIITVFFILTSSLWAEEKDEKSSFTFDSKLSARYESVDWFGGDKDSYHYNFGHTRVQLGTSYKKDSFRFYLQGQYFQLYDLPSSASGPGAVYFTTNGSEDSPGKAAVRQAYGEIQDSFGNVTLGRFLYSSGSEAQAAQSILANVRSARVMQRLIGPFDYTSGRSFDGGKGTMNTEAGAFSGLFFMPTEGGFEIDQNRTMNEIKVAGLSWTEDSFTDENADHDLQAFLYGYFDTRETVKADNRPLDIRTADTGEIDIATLGAHWTSILKRGETSVDSLLWGAAQAGNWGNEDHRAYSLTAEISARRPESRWKHTLRLGYTLGSGDNDPADNDHETFFQMLPTARAFAMTPFYNMQNTQDLFAEISTVPHEDLKLKSSLHWIQLTENEDALYSGGGANEVHGGFGYAAKPSKGSHDVGSLMDIEAVWTITPQILLTAYYGHLFGGNVTAAGDGSDRDIDYFFTELTAKLG